MVVDKEPIMLASFGTHFGDPIVEEQFALEDLVMSVGAARANFIVEG